MGKYTRSELEQLVPSELSAEHLEAIKGKPEVEMQEGDTTIFLRKIELGQIHYSKQMVDGKTGKKLVVCGTYNSVNGVRNKGPAYISNAKSRRDFLNPIESIDIYPNDLKGRLRFNTRKGIKED